MASDRQYTDFNFDFGEGRKSVHDVRVIVPSKEWETYFSQMRKFAEANDFKIRIVRPKPYYDVFFVDLWRSDAALIGWNMFDLPELLTGFYVDPEKGGTADVAAALVESMKEFISQVPGITIRQTK